MVGMDSGRTHMTEPHGVSSQFVRFCRSKHFGTGLKGGLATSSVGRTPLTIIANCESQYLPFECMFKRVVVVGSPGYCSSRMKLQRGDAQFSVALFRW